MKRVARRIVGWRGMVGSVLMQRMLEENDFASDRAGVLHDVERRRRRLPRSASESARSEDANDLAALAANDVIITCQGGDYTPGLSEASRGRLGRLLDRRRQDAAHAGRRRDHPRSRSIAPVIDAALARGVRNYIGGNCTVTPDDDGAGGIVPARPDRVDDLHDLPGGVGRWRADDARAAAADGRGASRREEPARRSGLGASSTSIARSPASCATRGCPTEHTGVPLAGSLIPWIDRISATA